MPMKGKVTPRKTVKKRIQKKLSKRRPVLSKRVKKILEVGGKKPKVIMFENKKHNDFYDVKISSVSKPIEINVVDHPLDQYSSPHLLNLSAKKYIERVKPTMDNSLKLSYSDLPAGHILEKIHFFDLLSFEDSEIVNFFKSIYCKLKFLTKKPFQQIDFSPKLPLASDSKKRLVKRFKVDCWQEVSLVNFFIFLGCKTYVVFSFIWQFGDYLYSSLIGQYVGKDEVIAFESRQISDNLMFDNIQNNKTGFKKPSSNFEFKNIFKNFEFNRGVLRPALAFFVLAFVITIPVRSYFYWQSAKEVKGRVLGQAEEALSSLNLAQGALTDFKFTDAGDYIANANNDFVSAQNQLNDINSFLTVLADTLPVSNSYRSGKNLLELGEKLTKAGEHLLIGLEQLTKESNLSLSTRAINFKSNLKDALTQFESAQENLDKVKISHLPEENRNQFILLQDKLPIFIDSLKETEDVVDFAINFLGVDDLKRYLLVFQNDNELRATGGFMGSFALVDFKNGKIDNIETPGGGTYDIRAGFTKLLKSPEPMWLINPRWEFQDSNWWPDFPTSAKNIAYFYNKSDGATIDGVIAINSDWLGDLLGVLGPVELPDHQKTITAANFEMELQKSVEIEYEDKKTPKKIIGDLAPKIMDRIFNIEPDQIMGLVGSLNNGLAEKDIMINLFSDEQQEFVASNNWDGRMKDAQKDYLSIVSTNIGGGKTDSVLNQDIYHKAKILEDGSVIDTVLISRNHFGPIDNDFTNVSNRSYLRVYVPLGSELLHVQGFKRPVDSDFKKPEDYLQEDSRLFNEKMAMVEENTLTDIYTENNKTVFGNWLNIEPGESQDVLLVYKLPFKVNLSGNENTDGFLGRIRAAFLSNNNYDSYSLLVQKQAGSDNDNFSAKVEYPDNVEIIVTYPEELEVVSENVIYNTDLDKDLFYFVGLNNK
jgi:hypothetical protein